MIRVAILSFAHDHADFWAAAFTAEPGIELVGVRDDDRGREAAGRFATRFFVDPDAVLGACDAVAICSETVAHAPLIVLAAKAGRAILCEKPLATDLASAALIVDAVTASGVVATASSALGLAVDDQAIAVFDYANGVLAEIVSSFSFAAADTSIEIYGAEGTALVAGVDLASRDITGAGFLRVYRRGQPEKAWAVSPIVPHRPLPPPERDRLRAGAGAARIPPDRPRRRCACPDTDHARLRGDPARRAPADRRRRSACQRLSNEAASDLNRLRYSTVTGRCAGLAA